jgi:hypothetical protein
MNGRFVRYIPSLYPQNVHLFGAFDSEMYRRYLVKVHFIARTAQIGKDTRQSIITFRHEGQSIWKISRTLKVSSSAVAKTINCPSLP